MSFRSSLKLDIFPTIVIVNWLILFSIFIPTHTGRSLLFLCAIFSIIYVHVLFIGALNFRHILYRMRGEKEKCDLNQNTKLTLYTECSCVCGLCLPSRAYEKEYCKRKLFYFLFSRFSVKLSLYMHAFTHISNIYIVFQSIRAELMDFRFLRKANYSLMPLTLIFIHE